MKRFIAGLLSLTLLLTSPVFAVGVKSWGVRGSEHSHYEWIEQDDNLTLKVDAGRLILQNLDTETKGVTLEFPSSQYRLSNGTYIINTELETVFVSSGKAEKILQGKEGKNTLVAAPLWDVKSWFKQAVTYGGDVTGYGDKKKDLRIRGTEEGLTPSDVSVDHLDLPPVEDPPPPAIADNTFPEVASVPTSPTPWTPGPSVVPPPIFPWWLIPVVGGGLLVLTGGEDDEDEDVVASP